MKYKLLKDLPDCEAGTTKEIGEDGLYEFGGYKYTPEHIAALPLWFEKVEEKTYEILQWDWEGPLSSKKLRIHSVKRLSDGEIITVGEEWFHPSWGLLDVTQIEEESGHLLVRGRYAGFETSSNIENISRPPAPAKTYTQQEVDEMKEHHKEQLHSLLSSIEGREAKAFYAAREKIGGDIWRHNNYDVYSTNNSK